jgi:predicted TIM-barrel fold metal-dependent hydrolase
VSKLENIISADSHIVEPYELYETVLGKKWGDATPRLVRDDENGKLWFTGRTGEYFLIDGASDAGRLTPEMQELELKAGYDLDARLKTMEIDGLRAEVVTGTWSLYAMHTENAELRRDCATVYNDWCIEFLGGIEDRLIGLAQVPLDDMEWALAEFERVVGKGIRGIMIPVDNHEPSPPYRDPYYDRFWAAAAEAGMPIMLHIITGPEQDPFTLQGEGLSDAARSDIRTFNEIQPVLANEFIFGRILDRFPDLRLVTGEFEVGWLAPFGFRVDQFHEDFAPLWGMEKLPQKASKYAATRVYHGVINDPMLGYVMQVFDGDVKVMWGSDFPHPRNTFPNTRPFLEEYLAPLPDDQANAVAAGNAAELFGIKL